MKFSRIFLAILSAALFFSPTMPMNSVAACEANAIAEAPIPIEVYRQVAAGSQSGDIACEDGICSGKSAIDARIPIEVQRQVVYSLPDVNSSDCEGGVCVGSFAIDAKVPTEVQRQVAASPSSEPSEC